MHSVKDDCEVKNLYDVIREVTDCLNPNEEYWYRGHSNVSYELIPTVLRPISEGEKTYFNEEKLLSEFVRRHPASRKEHQSPLELLTYAQHYGLPTRLLDWTENLLVALYFCCCNPRSDGKLYVLKTFSTPRDSLAVKLYENLVQANDGHSIFYDVVKHLKLIKKTDPGAYTNTLSLNGIDFEDLEKFNPLNVFTFLKDLNQNSKSLTMECRALYAPSRRIDGFVTYKPPLINKRLIAQKGCFTVHGGKIIGSNEILKVNSMETLLHGSNSKKESNAVVSNKVLQEFIIPCASKKTILEQLNYCGMNHATLFPELENQTKDIKELCKY